MLNLSNLSFLNVTKHYTNLSLFLNYNLIYPYIFYQTVNRMFVTESSNISPNKSNTSLQFLQFQITIKLTVIYS